MPPAAKKYREFKDSDKVPFLKQRVQAREAERYHEEVYLAEAKASGNDEAAKASQERMDAKDKVLEELYGLLDTAEKAVKAAESEK